MKAEKNTTNTEADVWSDFTAEPIRASSQRTYNSYLNAFGKKNLPASPEDILEWLKATEYKASAINTAMAALSHWHNENKESNPTLDNRLKKAVSILKNQRPDPCNLARAITPEEISKMLSAINEEIERNEESLDKQLQWIRDGLFVFIGIYFVLRVSEICRIKYEHITVEDEGICILFPETKTTSTTKSIKIHDEDGDINPAVRFLELWLDKSKIQHGYLFRRIQNGTVTSNPQKPMTLNGFALPALRRVADAAHVNLEGLKTHSLRVTGVTTLYLAEVDIARISQQAHHQDLRTTLKYIRLNTKQQIEESVANDISLLVKGPSKTESTTSISKLFKFFRI